MDIVECRMLVGFQTLDVQLSRKYASHFMHRLGTAYSTHDANFVISRVYEYCTRTGRFF